ncbi:MAG: ATP synthase subunit I [Acidimicrobiales bacterium]
MSYTPGIEDSTLPPIATIGAPSIEPSPAAAIARDMVRRGMYVLPVAMAVTALVGDRNDALSVGYGMVVIMANFLLSAYLLVWAARISLGLVASVALGGYAMRLALVFVAVWLIKDTSWVRMIPLGITIIATHLGLLVWELRHVSATFAHPGLKPSSGSNFGRGSKPAAGYRPKRQVKKSQK